MRGVLALGIGAIAIWSSLQFGSVVTFAQVDKTGAASSLRTPWGEPDLRGVWQGVRLGAQPGQDRFNLARLETLRRPEARENLKAMSAKDDPILQCLPPAFPRAASLGTPIQILQKPQFLLVLTEAYHSFRNIPTDGRPHLAEDFRIPLSMGDSSGRWEGNTLVVDVISFKQGENWLASGQDKPTKTSMGVWPTSEELHVIERWRRVDADTLVYQAQVEDPAMLTGPWETPAITLKRLNVARIQEVPCLVTEQPATYLERLGR